MSKILKMLINGETLIKSLLNKEKIDCNTNWYECSYFFNGECTNKNVENSDETIECPYYILRKK